MYNIDKKDKNLWDTETSFFNEIAYDIYVKEVEKINYQLYLKGNNIHCPCATLSDFIIIQNDHILKKYTNKANIILRRYKINKIQNG